MIPTSYRELGRSAQPAGDRQAHHSLRIFISYATPDLAYATTVKALLASLGFRSYLAEYDLRPGESFDRLMQELRSAQVLLVLWSEHARVSDWVPQEVGVAIGAGRLVLPVALDERSRPPAFLAKLKYVNAHKDPMGSLPVIQDVILQWARWIQDRRAAAAQKERTDAFWAGTKTLLAVVGGVAVLDWLSGDDDGEAD